MFVLNPIPCPEVDGVMASRAKDFKIRAGIVKVAKIYMVAFKNFGDFIISTIFTPHHLSPRYDIRGSNLIGVVLPPKANSAKMTTKSGGGAVAFGNELLMTEGALLLGYWLAHSFKLALSATRVLLAARRDCLEWGTAHLALFNKFCKDLSLSPADACPCVFSKVKFVTTFSIHTYIIP